MEEMAGMKPGNGFTKSSSAENEKTGQQTSSSEKLTVLRKRECDDDEDKKDGPSSPKKSRVVSHDKNGASAEEINVENEVKKSSETEKKKGRTRLKYVIQSVLDQMEFYFGDSNMSKDRYLKQMIDASPDGYVDLSVFGNFNKLQSLRKEGVSLKILQKALKKSKTLEVNEEGNKVRRTTPFVEITQEETDNRTVYVEHLPDHANHAWIKTIFSQCGKVSYVSLPTYRTTKQIKGFAFVEFSSAEEAAKACTMLNNPLPAKSEEKPGIFPKGNKTLNRLQRKTGLKSDQDSNEENVSDDMKSGSTPGAEKKKKRKKMKKKKAVACSDDKKTDQTAEGKKKKKKKKKKASQQGDSADGSCKKKDQSCTSKQENVTSDSNSQEQATETGGLEEEGVEEKVAGKPVNETGKEKAVEEVQGKKKKKKKKKKKGDKKSQQEEGAGMKTADSCKESFGKEDVLATGEDSEAKDENMKDKSSKESLNMKEDSKPSVEDGSKAEEKQGNAEMSGEKEMHIDTEIKTECNKDSTITDTGNGRKISEITVKGPAQADTLASEEKKSNVTLNRKERKRLRQEDIRKKKLERERKAAEEANTEEEKQTDADISDAVKVEESNTSIVLEEDSSVVDASAEPGGRRGRKRLGSSLSDIESPYKVRRKSDGSELTSCLVKSKKHVQKKVEFDPVPITTEFVKGKEIRRRKKQKREKPHLRVLSKKDWLLLKSEYIAHQKSHMAALKESLRELRQQENQGSNQPKSYGMKHVDLEDVFGTKRMKPTQEVKMAHVEALKFTPNVIVQWKCSHEMHRDKIRTMFKEISGDSIAYIDAGEEAKSGFIRFKDEKSAEDFTKRSRSSASFSARVLPAEQQQAYWERANKDRLKKLGRKKQEKGAQRIARKVFQRNHETFHQKPSRTVFNDEDDKNKSKEEDSSGDRAEKRKQMRENCTGIIET